MIRVSLVTSLYCHIGLIWSVQGTNPEHGFGEYQHESCYTRVPHLLQNETHEYPTGGDRQAASEAGQKGGSASIANGGLTT